MPFGTYKPYFHGELVTEYKNSLCKMKAQQSNGETGVIDKPTLEVYEEPGESFRNCLCDLKQYIFSYFYSLLFFRNNIYLALEKFGPQKIMVRLHLAPKICFVCNDTG